MKTDSQEKVNFHSKIMWFFCVNKGTSNQADLEDFIEDDFTNNLERITRQAYPNKEYSSIHYYLKK